MITLPDRQTIIDRLVTELANDHELGDIQTHEILGIDEAIVTQATEKRVWKPLEVDREYKKSRRDWGESISEGDYLTVVGAGQRQAVRPLLDCVVTRQWSCIAEISRSAGTAESITHVPDGMVQFQWPHGELLQKLRNAKKIPVREKDQEITHQGAQVTLAPPSFTKLYENATTWECVQAPWDETITLAAVHNTGKHVLVFANVCMNDTWESFAAGEETTRDARVNLWNEIVTLVEPHLQNLHLPPKLDDELATVYKAISEFEALRTMGISQLSSVEARLANAQKQLAKARTDADAARQALTSSMQKVTACEEEVTLFSGNRTERLRAALGAAYGATEQLAMLRPIRHVEFTEVNNNPALRVQLYDLAMKTGSVRRRITDLDFTVYFDQHGSLICNFPEHKMHPHVCDGIPCFGNANQSLAEAAGRRDWVVIMNVIIRWAATYNPNSPHYDASEFPKTDLPAGWIVEDK